MITMKRALGLLAVAGSAAVSAGAGLLWSPGVALIVGGGQAIAAAVVLYDPERGE